MPVKITGLNFIEKKLEAVLAPAGAKIAHELEQRIIAEMPVASGAMRESVKVETRRSGLFFNTIIRITAPYARAVWKGLDPDVYNVSPRPGNTHGMYFTADRWPQYDGRFGYKTSFLFKQTLRNNIPPNDFIGRAIKDLSFIQRAVIREIKVVFGK